MKRRVSLAVSLCLMAGLIFQGAQGFPAFAAEKETVAELEGETDSEAVADEELSEDSETEAETELETTGEEETEAVTETESEAADEVGTEAESESEEEDSVVGELIFAQCEEYINIRDEASTDGEITAKIYNNGSATVLSVDGEWYEITSGNAHGYVKAEYFATGEEAAAIAEKIAYNVATVRVEYLNIRAEASTDSELVDVAKENDEIEVVLYGEDWMKVALGNDVYGYIKAEYVDYATYYPVAETLEEEEARLIAEGLLAETEAVETDKAADSEQTEAASTEETEQTDAVTAQTASETSVETEAELSDLPAQTSYEDAGTAQAETIVQTEAPQTETAAQTEAPQAETAAQTEAPQTETAAQTEAAQTETAAQTEAPQTETATQTEAAQTEAATQTEAPQTETVVQTEVPQTETVAQTEAVQTETAAQTEAPQTEAETEAASSSSSSSSTGESIADYALQFIGNPYVYGGTSLTDGADCSGFVQSVFAHFGIYLSRTAAAQATNGTTISLSELQAGDLLFYSSTGDGSIDHVAIYIGNGCIVHAANSTRGICTDSAYYSTPVCAVRCY